MSISRRGFLILTQSFNTMKVLIGKKIGMTQIYTEDGNAIAATVLDVSDNVVSKKLANNDTVTHIELGKDRQKKPRKADLGNYKGLNYIPRYKYTLKVEDEDTSLEVGSAVKADIFNVGDYVDVQGETKGKGFAGVVKRYGMRGGPRTHGASDRERAIGSIGMRTIPGRVFKGKRMAGHMGAVKQSTRNLKILVVDPIENILVVSGAVQGTYNSYVVIKKTR